MSDSEKSKLTNRSSLPQGDPHAQTLEALADVIREARREGFVSTPVLTSQVFIDALEAGAACLRTSGQQTEEKKDDGAGLIHQVASPLVGTEPRLNIPISAEELDWVEHAARLRHLTPTEYVRRAINLSLRSEGVDAVLLTEDEDCDEGPTCESCSEPATHITSDDVDMCAECYQALCDEQGVTGQEVGSVPVVEGEASGPTVQERSAEEHPHSALQRPEPPVGPEALVDALQDRIHPASGRLLSASAILQRPSGATWLPDVESRFAELISTELDHYAQKIAKRVLRKALGGKIAERSSADNT